MHLEDYFGKFGNHEVITEKIKQQLLELTSIIGFSIYENHKHCDKKQQASIYGTGTQIKENYEKSISMKKMKKKKNSKERLLKYLYRKAHIIFLWFVTVTFIVDHIIFRRNTPFTRRKFFGFC